jgi:hypothetical protein
MAKTMKIIVATHKTYWMPEDPLYLPVHVGAAGKESLGYVRDDTGDNISGKNVNYCELTGLYWAWKNLEADYVGLAHYRRHFSARRHLKADRRFVITEKELRQVLSGTDVVLPVKRNYFIETNYSQYVHAHHKEDLDLTRQILSEKYPAFVQAYDASMKRTDGHRFNMFIMKREYFDAYCKWLFDILFELERRLDISSYSPYDARVFGFVSERLLDVWIGTKNISYKELPCMFMENQNWLVKGGNFLLRKIGMKK